jgi:hypothetical protein
MQPEIRCCEPRWIFAGFHLNGTQTLADAMPVHTPGSGSDGVTVSPSPEAMAMSLIGLGRVKTLVGEGH